MTTLRVGTRGSDLALWQTGWVSDALRAAHPGLNIERIIIQTHGDAAIDQRFDADWPVGGFVDAIEKALIDETIDFAVHSFKDMQTAITDGLIVAAIPQREVVHDVLVTREPVDLDHLPAGFKLGTSSPRRMAQFRRLGNLEILPLRGNVPTRIKKLQAESLDGVVLAAAGLKRLSIQCDHCTNLPTDRFVPAPAQGALAIQTRVTGEARSVIESLDHAATRRPVEAERAFLKAVGAGCHVPIGALASLEGESIRLQGQLFDDDGLRMAEGVEFGSDPEAIGVAMARTLQADLERGR